MLNQKGLRKIFQITALILFIIQFKQSVRKYFQAPVVVQESRVPVKDLPPPVIYVCNTKINLILQLQEIMDTKLSADLLQEF